MAANHLYSQFTHSQTPYTLEGTTGSNECDLVDISSGECLHPSFTVLSGWNLDGCDLYSPTSPSSSSSFSSFVSPAEPENTRFYTLTGALQPTASFPESSQRTNLAPRNGSPLRSSLTRGITPYATEPREPVALVQQGKHTRRAIPPDFEEKSLVRINHKARSDMYADIRDDQADFKLPPVDDDALSGHTAQSQHNAVNPQLGTRSMVASFHTSSLAELQNPESSVAVYAPEPLHPVVMTMRLASDSMDVVDEPDVEFAPGGEPINDDSDGGSEYKFAYSVSPEQFNTTVDQNAATFTGSAYNEHLTGNPSGPFEGGDSKSPAWSHRESDSDFDSDHADRYLLDGNPHHGEENQDVKSSSVPPVPRRNGLQQEQMQHKEEIRHALRGKAPKKVKMHQCQICNKCFPRPSGLATHMNSHSGARPYACPLATCTKTFAVRSNARRHLRTHGITLPSTSTRHGPREPPPFEVLFETPLVASSSMPDEHFKPMRGSKVRRVPPSLASRTNAPRLRSLSPSSDMADLDGDDGEEDWEYEYKYHHYHPPAASRTAPVPLTPVTPSEPSADLDEKFEERNSYAEAGTYPYHPEQVRTSSRMSSFWVRTAY